MEINQILNLIILIIVAYTTYKIGSLIQKKENKEIIREIIKKEREDAIKRSRRVLTGQFSEQMSPYLPSFPEKPSECKFLGAPLDLICFKGLDEKEVTEIIFIEIKSQNARMNATERSIKKAIENKKVKFVEYRIPEIK